MKQTFLETSPAIHPSRSHHRPTTVTRVPSGTGGGVVSFVLERISRKTRWNLLRATWCPPLEYPCVRVYRIPGSAQFPSVFGFLKTQLKSSP
ncbi:hypothetical protein pipiens_007416 [Culex pipiens pipiens]|uniref:Uncharacterized protein n=1 Tax=Culex pipiens pipiens TaxID=38569 RepID=A0ABD1DL35_CULPP